MHEHFPERCRNWQSRLRVGRYSDAISIWKSIARNAGKLAAVTGQESHFARIRVIQFRLNLNLAQGYLKTLGFQRAHEFASLALAHYDRNSKALYRKATAAIGLGNYGGALALLNRILHNEHNAAANALRSEVLKILEKTKNTPG